MRSLPFLPLLLLLPACSDRIGQADTVDDWLRYHPHAKVQRDDKPQRDGDYGVLTVRDYRMPAHPLSDEPMRLVEYKLVYRADGTIHAREAVVVRGVK